MSTKNTYRQKGRALFLAAIMVISMAAVGFAAAPAAAQEGVTVDAPNTVSPGEEITVTLSSQQVDEWSVEGNVGGWTVVDTDPSTLSTFPDDGSRPYTSEDDSDTWGHVYGSTQDDASWVLTLQAPDTEGTYTLDAIAQRDGSSDTNSEFDITVEQGSDGGDGGDGTVENRDVADDGNVYITSGNTVYQGEEDLTFYDPASDTEYAASQLEGTSGNREGTPLQMPIPSDQATGTYDLNGPEAGNGGFSTTVVTPRITTSEVQLNGDDVDQVGSNNAANLQIAARWNFNDAEDLDLTVEDASGADITDEVVENPTLSGSGTQRTALDLSGEDAGEYTVVFEGSNNLDYDSVVQEYTIEVTDEDSLTLDVDEDSVTQGDNLGYTVSGGTNGQQHVVAIEASDFRDGVADSDAVRIFRNIEDTEERGLYDAEAGETITNANADYDIDDVTYAYAVVEIDGTDARGSLRSQYLDDSSIDIDVYEEDTPADLSNMNSADDVSFDVNEGDVTLESPSGTYTVNSQVDVSGSADSADDVGIYVRDNNRWEPVQIDGDQFISVDSDDTFEEEDVRLSQGNLGGNNILSFEGRYRIGVIDASDVTNDITNNDGSIGTSDFSSASSSQYAITVEEGDLTAQFGTINGQIAEEDGEIDVEGTAAGQDDVVIAFVDRRGRTVATTSSVDDDSFEEDDISIGSLSQGAVSAHVISLGRDGVVGDGDGVGNQAADASGLETYIQNIGGGSSSGDQIRSRIVSNTVDADGSDDLMVTANFRLNDATLSVRNVHPDNNEAEGVNPVATGETMVVSGDTNRQSDIAAITVEVLDQEDNNLESASTDDWGSDGQWSTSIDTSDLDPGTYIVEAEDGDSTDRVEIEIVDEHDTSDGDDGSDDGEDGSDDGDDGSDDGDDGSDDGDDGMDGDDGSDGEDGDDGETDDGTPGFGALVALVALVAAALLATRRNN